MKTIGCFLFMLLFMSLPAFAADVTLFGGMQHTGRVTLGSATSSSTVNTATTILKDPFSSGTFGIRVGNGKMWGHEETIAFTPNFIDSGSRALIMNSNVLVNIPTPVVRPYITAGFGAFVLKGSGPTDIGTKFAFNYGGGVKLLPEGPVGFRGDIRGYSILGVHDQTLNATEMSLGILFRF